MWIDAWQHTYIFYCERNVNNSMADIVTVFTWSQQNIISVPSNWIYNHTNYFANILVKAVANDSLYAYDSQIKEE